MSDKTNSKDVSQMVTVVVSRRIKTGSEKLFEKLNEDLTVLASGFDGYLGAVMLRPSSQDDPEYRIVYKFENQKKLDVWLNSKDRLEILDEIESLLESKSSVSTSLGIMTWLSFSEKNRSKQPEKYKITIVSWLALYPLITSIFILFGTQLSQLPLLLKTFVVTAVAMYIMSYILMPRMTHWFAFWLFPKEKRDIR